MKDTGETQSTAFDSDQDTRPEYRFIYNRAELRKEVFSFSGMFLLALAYCTYLYFFDPVRFGKIFDNLESVVFSFFPILFLFLLWFFTLTQLSRRGITINREGMACTGFSSREMPRHCSWNEISEIHVNNCEKGLCPQRQLFFIYRSIRQYFLPIGKRKRQFYIGVGHALSLEEAIERFIGPIGILSEAGKNHRQNINFDLGKKAGLVAYTALAIAVLACALTFLSRPFLLDNALTLFLLLAVGLGASAMAWRYVWGIEQEAIMIFPVLLFGGMVAWMSFPLICYSSVWLGKEGRIVFAISKEDHSEAGYIRQYWRATADSKLTFSIHARSDNLVYMGEGTELPMTVYRGPWSLNALPAHEYRALFREYR
ncbi:MAG: hypothetical protein LBP90_02760 [Burkholderiales bacterium]|jgi:hypothetical protein|nr:hypothetical protein [Burkholderiales bacterium]